jgi:hypothetical protein
MCIDVSDHAPPIYLAVEWTLRVTNCLHTYSPGAVELMDQSPLVCEHVEYQAM